MEKPLLQQADRHSLLYLCPALGGTSSLFHISEMSHTSPRDIEGEAFHKHNGV